MATTLEHECGKKTRKELFATMEAPYHYVDSGLSNVYLVGIRYFVCECGEIVAEIPAVHQLLELIARDLVEKPKALAPEEIKFLRKRLGKKQIDFAREIGVRPETLSRFETGETRVNERTDKLIRLYYAIASQDRILLDKLQNMIEALLVHWKSTRKPAHIVSTFRDDEWKAQAVAA